MSGATAVGRRRLGRWALLGLALLGLAVLAAGVWWRRGRAAEAPPGPTDEALAAADPEIAAAVRVARQRVQREPGSVEAWGLLGQVLEANGFPAEADACLARAEALDPDDPRWPYLRAYGLTHDRDAAFAAAGRAVAACQRAGRVEAAPYLYLAELYVERNDRKQADELCRRVLEHEPNNARAHLDLGLTALADNDLKECLPHLLRATEGPTVRQTAYAQLATAYQRLGDEAAAADYARRARQTPADEPAGDPYVDSMHSLMMGRQVRQRLLEQMEAQGRMKEAIALLRKMTADDPSDEHSFVLLGVLLTRSGDLAGAEQALRTARGLAPDSVDPAYFLAAAFWSQGERLEAAGDRVSAAEKFQASADTARRATEMKPDHAQALMLLGLTLRRLGRNKEAIEPLRAALRCRPEEAEVHLVLGEALAEDGQQTQAITELQCACDLAGPGDPRFRQALDRARAGRKPTSWLWP